MYGYGARHDDRREVIETRNLPVMGSLLFIQAHDMMTDERSLKLTSSSVCLETES